MGEHIEGNDPSSMELQILRARVEALQAELDAMRNSTIWRGSAPLRRLIETARRKILTNPRLANLLRRGRSRLLLRRHPGQTRQNERKEQTGQTLAEMKESFKRESETALQAFLSGSRRLHIPSAGQPLVSIIIVLYNQAAMTYKCLLSLARDQGVPFEVIVFDNASSDETAVLMSMVDGVHYIPNAENSGFLLAVNSAARMAKGDYVLLLNNDAEILPGTLARAARRLKKDTSAGAVGGKIILPDGNLQEAGSMVWPDGSCRGYGRGERPDAPQFQFVRRVDYCSGAFLLVRRSLFEAFEGFDPDYAPAYYEESDFCIRLAKQGYPVVYDPGVEISHYEFASADSQAKALDLQQRNRRKFTEKHRDYLASKPTPSGAAPELAARDLTPYKGRILFIEDRVPHADLGRGYPRTRCIIQELCALGWFITFYPLVIPQDEWEQVYRTLPEQVEVMLGNGTSGLHDFLASRPDYYDYLLVGRPHNMMPVQLLHNQNPDLFRGMRIVYDAEAVFALRTIKMAQTLGQFYSPNKLQKMLDDELALAKLAHCIMAVSQAEAAHFSKAGNQRIEIISHMLEPQPSPAEFQDRNGLLFVGALTEDTSPNVDSLEWFVNKVMPELKNLAGETPLLTVIGQCTSGRAIRLERNSVRILGRVEDLSTYYNQARIFLVPTRFAAGIPHKAHEAAAHGVPMVATSLIASQLDWQDGCELLVGDDPMAFAKAVSRLYSEKALWQEIRQNALTRVETDCSRTAFVAGLERIFTSEKQVPCR